MSNNERRFDILDSNTNIEPVGVVWNLKKTDIETYIGTYFSEKGVGDSVTVQARVRNEGKARPVVSLYAFVPQNSNLIQNNVTEMPELIRDKVDNDIEPVIADNFKSILRPLCGDTIRAGKVKGRRMFFVELDVFYSIGLMLKAIPGQHRLIITDAKAIPNSRDAVISVVKQQATHFGKGRRNGGMDYDNIMAMLDRQ